MKAPAYKKASLGMVAPKKRTAKLVVKKQAPYPTKGNKSVFKKK